MFSSYNKWRIVAVLAIFCSHCYSVSMKQMGNLQYRKYTWKHDFEVSFVREGQADKPALLLLPGFGVGAFHYDRNIQELSKNFEVYSLDLLGQGSRYKTTMTQCFECILVVNVNNISYLAGRSHDRKLI